MSFKKILYVTLIIIVVPYLIVTFFIGDDEIHFEYVSNMTVRVKRTSTDTIEEVPFEEYIIGVLAGEMPVSFELEALKAQAVAARSYVMRKMAENRKKDYDIVDTVMNQVYLSDDELKAAWKDTYVEKVNKIKTAVLETHNEYVAYHGEVIEAFFFSTSVGMTENSKDVFGTALPYLQSVESMWDKNVSPVFSESNKFTLTEFYQKLGLPYQAKITTETLSTTSTGRIKKIKINGKTFTGSEVCEKLKIRSAYFNIKQDSEKVLITTKGYGHGVGLSQYGAEGMAKAGYQYDEIIKHYYQGTEIKTF